MSQITESAAREILRQVGSGAAKAEHYLAKRAEGGWIFAWNLAQGSAPFGVRAWVVTDSARPAMVKLGESGSQALSRLNSQ
ncbi:MAG: hypothetical protein LBJ62_10555 [Bifidobacteriaceae bacterium]|jgi:hypothetical protein|nr:hypothetical protein [Bifidobacteriaceae bacterium]